MNEAMTSFLEIAVFCAPFSIAWNIGIMAYNFVVDAFTGRNAQLR